VKVGTDGTAFTTIGKGVALVEHPVLVFVTVKVYVVFTKGLTLKEAVVPTTDEPSDQE
jgi:hypothetical protein